MGTSKSAYCFLDLLSSHLNSLPSGNPYKINTTLESTLITKDMIASWVWWYVPRVSNIGKTEAGRLLEPKSFRLSNTERSYLNQQQKRYDIEVNVH